MFLHRLPLLPECISCTSLMPISCPTLNAQFKCCLLPEPVSDSLPHLSFPQMKTLPLVFCFWYFLLSPATYTSVRVRTTDCICVNIFISQDSLNSLETETAFC